MTEEEIRQIVRDEIEKSRPLQHHKGIPLPPNSPIAWPVRELPMPVYRYQETSAIPGTGWPIPGKEWQVR